MATSENDPTSDLKRVTVDGETVERFTPAEQQEAIQNETLPEAAKRPHFGARFTRLVPPGTG